jgi:hypothetical protein
MLPAACRGTGARTLAFIGALALTLVVAGPATAKVKRFKLGDFQYAKDSSSIPFAGSVETTSGDLEVKCDRGWKIVGGGADPKGLPGHTRMGTTSLGGNRSWYSEALHLDSDKTKLNGYAICVHDRSTDTSTEVTNTAAGPTTSGNDVACPAGLAAMGGGARLVGVASNWLLNSTYPIDNATDPDSFPDDAWQVYVGWAGPAPTNYLVDIICGEDPPVYKVKQATLDTPSPFTTAKATARCPKGRHVTGGGALISGPVFEAYVLSSYPVDGKDRDKAPDDGWRAAAVNADGSSKTLTTHAICL